MNFNERFFAFGCSFTASHDRPTWADIVGRQFTSYQNWARGGMGNHYIFNSLIEAHQRNKFTPNDTVMIMWSSFTREDRYVDHLDGWFGQGNIYWSTEYPQEFVKKFACERGYLIRDLALISAARDLLKYWGVNYRMLAMMPLGLCESKKSLSFENNDVFDLYKDVLEEIKPSVFEIIFNNEDWNKKHSDFGAYVAEGVRDSHPDPREALEYVQTVLPEIALKQETIDWAINFKLGDHNPEFYNVKRF